MENNKGMLGDLLPNAEPRDDGIQSIGNIATFMVLGYSRTEVAEMVGISEQDLASVLSANADLFRKEFERNRSLLMVNMESKVFKKIDDILNLEPKEDDNGNLLKEQVKLINGVMNLICKLQEKKVSVKSETKATKVVVDFVGMSTDEKKKALKEIRESQTNERSS